MHFWTRYSVDLGFLLKFSLTKVCNFVGNFKNYVNHHLLIIALFRKTIMR
jgi:hypothetical protein